MNAQTVLFALTLFSPLIVHGLRLQYEDSTSLFPPNNKDTICVPCESPFYVQPVGRPKFLMCTPFKNGYDWWSSVFCLAQSRGSTDGISTEDLTKIGIENLHEHDPAAHPTGIFLTTELLKKKELVRDKVEACRADSTTSEYMKKSRILDRLWEGRSTFEIMQAERDPTLQKFKLVRNPLTRTLAGWLTWTGRHSEKVRMEGNEVEDDFADFVNNTMKKVRNPHWSEQFRQCSWNEEGSPVKFTILKVEDRDEWADEYVEKLQLAPEVALNGGMEKLNNGHRCPGHGCSAAPLMKKYYTLEVLDEVAEFFKRDIEAYNYTAEVAAWREVIADAQKEADEQAILHGFRNAAEEAKMKAQEAKKKAEEEEAKQKAKEEAQKRAEEAAKKKALWEAEKKAKEEEAKKMAEEEEAKTEEVANQEVEEAEATKEADENEAKTNTEEEASAPSSANVLDSFKNWFR